MRKGIKTKNTAKDILDEDRSRISDIMDGQFYGGKDETTHKMR